MLDQKRYGSTLVSPGSECVLSLFRGKKGSDISRKSKSCQAKYQAITILFIYYLFLIHSYLFWPASAKNSIDVNMCSLPFPHRTANCTAALLIITELQYEWRCPYMAKELQRHGPVELSHAQRSRMTSVSG